MTPVEIAEKEPRIAIPKEWQSFSVRAVSVKESEFTAKRVFDIALSSVGIVVSLPLWFVIGLAIYAEDGQPVFYSQERVGKGGKIFDALKFRTMNHDAEEWLGPVQAMKNDPRTTRIGKILRKTALDELPQLWNILKGDMSFVGPRPLRPGEILADENGQEVVLEEIEGYEDRIKVMPGLTGLAQVYTSRCVHHRQKFRYDLIYVKNHSFWLDMKLIALSFLRTFTGRWEA